MGRDSFPITEEEYVEIQKSANAMKLAKRDFHDCYNKILHRYGKPMIANPTEQACWGWEVVDDTIVRVVYIT